MILIKNILNNKIDDAYSRRAIVFCKRYLPKQGPLEYFVHHNTLHAFEEYDFFESLRYSSSLFNAKTHKSLVWYQESFSSGRVNEANLLDIAKKYLSNIDNNILKEILFWNEDIPVGKSSVLEHKILSLVKAKRVSVDVPNKFRCLNTYWDFIKSRDEKKRIKLSLNEIKMDFFSAFFDKGNSFWSMENQERGLLVCFYDYVKFMPNFSFKKTLSKLIIEIKTRKSDIEKISSLLSVFNIPLEYIDSFMFQVLYDLKGWSALVFAIDDNENFNPTGIALKLDEYIVVNLLLEVASFSYFSEKGFIDEFEYDYEVKSDQYDNVQAHIFNILKRELDDDVSLMSFYESHAVDLSNVDENLIFKIWHEAYELNLIGRLVTSYSLSRNIKCSLKSKPSIQVVTCIDDREESTRRYFEEYDKSNQTFGYAGHFGLNIQYKSIRETHFRALCPLGASPDYYVWEELKNINCDELRARYLAKLKHFVFHNSKLPLTGLVLTFLLAPFSLMLFLFESFLPDKIHVIRRRFKRVIFPEVETQLNFLSSESRELKGYTLEEATTVLLSMLKTIGLTKDFADIVYLCGHGSKSMNNPHGAAYNCGACAGGKGAANARLLATIANRGDVRKKLESYNIFIPESTFFVGGYHCTSSDKLLVFDKEAYPASIIAKLSKACRYVEERDAKERLRKFEDVPLNISHKDALMAATCRAYDFSQPRPEYGHNTNAFCIVGKRINTKAMFLDRRAFLVEYEEKEDDGDFNNLLGLLSAVIPVCAGINLEYYFSYVDREVFGAGGKQAHNVTSLIGVMNGYKSDLRLGLPWQMVEIHEPSRIICIVEACSEVILKLMDKNHNLKNLIGNDWVKLICVDGNDNYMIFEGSGFKRVLIDSSCSDVEKLNKESFDSCFKDTRGLTELYVKGIL